MNPDPGNPGPPNPTDRTPNHARAMDRLVENERITSTEAIMLPIDKPLSREQHGAVRAAVKNFITDGQGAVAVPYKQVAQEMGLSQAVVSEYMRGKYKGNNDRVARSLNLWLDRHQKRARSRGVREYVETWVAEEMMAFVHFADRKQKMAAIVSPSGSGKDMVIEAMAEQLNGVIVYCDAQTTATRLVQEIAEAIGLPVIKDTHTLKKRVIKRLRDRSTILFINEAQQLARRDTGARAASVLRSLYDQTRVPIVLFGSAEIFRFVDDRDPASGGGQLYRRCWKMNVMTKMAETEDPDSPGRVGRPLFSMQEVRRFLAMKRVRYTGDGFEALWKVANLTEHGTLGLCGDVIEAIADFWPHEAVTHEHVTSALSMLLDAEAAIVQARIEPEETGRKEAGRKQAAAAG